MKTLAIATVTLGAGACLAFTSTSSDTISITVRPLVNPLTASGFVSSGKAGETVTLQFRQCGVFPLQFRDQAEVRTEAGGSWIAGAGLTTNGAFRAVWGKAVSDEVKVLQRADVRLTPHPNRKYEVDVVSTLPFWKKRVLLQRFDRRGRTWVTVRKLVLQHTFGPGLIWSTTDRFTVDVPRRTAIRAVLLRDQAKPCFIAGYSSLRTTA
jgi:hypothetical protein